METTLELPAKPPKRGRKVSIKDYVDKIAELCGKGYNETNAVILLDKFTVQAWFAYKSRGSKTAKINNMLLRARTQRVDRLMSEVEKAATGTQGVRHDWRAAQYWAGVLDPTFAAQRQDAGATTHNSVMSIHVGGLDALRRLVESCAPAPRQLTDAVSPGPSEQPAIGQPGQTVELTPARKD